MNKNKTLYKLPNSKYNTQQKKQTYNNKTTKLNHKQNNKMNNLVNLKSNLLWNKK